MCVVIRSTPFFCISVCGGTWSTAWITFGLLSISLLLIKVFSPRVMFICLVMCVQYVVKNSTTVVILCTPVPLNSILSLGFSFFLKSPGCNRVGSVPVIAFACPRVGGINWRLTSLSCKSNSILGNRGFHLRHEGCECYNLIRFPELFLPVTIFNQVGINLCDRVGCINAS